MLGVQRQNHYWVFRSLAFIQRLEENNIGVLPKIRGEELLGFTYIHNDVKIAGYQVYKPYSWNKLLSEYGITYDQEKDKEVIQQAKARAINRINTIGKSVGRENLIHSAIRLWVKSRWELL